MSTTTASVYSSPILSSFPTNPLTTTFTPTATTCSGAYASGGVYVFDADTSDCLPSSFPTASTDYFSPGLACPAGYVTACHDNNGVSSITTVTCCPYRGDITLGCVTPSTLSDVWSTLFCTWIAPESGTVVSVTLSGDGTTSTVAETMASPAGLNALGVRMVYEASDLETSSTSTTTTSKAGAEKTTSNGASVTDGLASSTAVADSGASSNNGVTGTSSGLSTGTTVAIAVVLSVVGIIAVTVAFLWMRRRKQHQQVYDSVEANSPGQPSYGGGEATGNVYHGYYDPKNTPELSGTGSSGVRDQQPMVQLGQANAPVELPHSNAVEMPGSTTWR